MAYCAAIITGGAIGNELSTNCNSLDFSDQCSDDNGDPECSMASDYQLIQAGIDNEHSFKEEYIGKKNGSRYDICACKDGSIKIAGRKQCGNKGPKIDTYASWK